MGKVAKTYFFIVYLHHNSKKTHAKLKPNGHTRATLTPLAQMKQASYSDVKDANEMRTRRTKE
jgi:hypothetical protein